MPSTATQKLQRYKILFISGNYSRILSRLDRNLTEQDVRRAITSFQLMTVLALKQTSREATVLLYALELDP